MTSPASNGTTNLYAPEPNFETGNDLPVLPPSSEMLTALLKRYSEYKYGHDAVATLQGQDSLFYRTFEAAEDGDEDVGIYRLHGSDTSLEATLCEFWSREHDIEFMSEYVCTLLNIAPSLIREVLHLRRTAYAGGNFTFDPCIEYDLINFMDRQLFPLDVPPDFPSANWFVMREDDVLAGFCSWKMVEHAGSTVGFHYRAGVMPTFRGRGLQKRMIEFRENEMRKEHLKDAVTYTDADNAASMRSLLKCGYLPYTPTEQTCLSGGLARLGRAGFVHWKKTL